LKRRGLVAAVAMLAVASLFAPYIWRMTRPVQAIVGQLAPSVQLVDVTNHPIQLQQYRGKTVLINFFTTWCAPCQAEAPDLQRIAAEHSNHLVVLMIDRGETSTIVRQFMTTYHLSTPIVLLDAKDQYAHAFGLTGQPETFLVDKNGVLRAHINHEMTYASFQSLLSDGS